MGQFGILGLMRAVRFKAIVVAIVLGIAIYLPLSYPGRALAFDKTNIVSDSVFLNKDSLSAGGIRDVMRSRGSGYTDYVIPREIVVEYPTGYHTWGYTTAYQEYGSEIFYGKLVSDLIYEEAQEHGINPQVVLVTLQKESSGITENIIGQPSDHWAMGYGYNDRASNCWNTGNDCDVNAFKRNAEDYGGVGQQIAYATYQLQNLYGRYAGSDLVTTIDGEQIHCANVATRVLYAYTPHFHGNENFYNIFNSWFGDPTTTVFYNDTSPLSAHTYNDRTELRGSKATDTDVYVDGSHISGSGSYSWTYSRDLAIGSNDFEIVYKVGGSTVAVKRVSLFRHKVGDINGDGGVNILDLSILSNNYGMGSPADAMANLNPTTDNEINLLDISIFANRWEG